MPSIWSSFASLSASSTFLSLFSLFFSASLERSLLLLSLLFALFPSFFYYGAFNQSYLMLQNATDFFPHDR